MTETAEPRVQLVRRAARLAAPPVPEGTVSVSPPPRVDSQPAGAVGWMQYLFPVVGSLGGMLFILNNPKPLFLASGVLFMAGSIGMGAGMAPPQRPSPRPPPAHPAPPPMEPRSEEHTTELQSHLYLLCRLLPS